MSIWVRGGSHYEVVLALVIAVVALTPLDTGTTRPLTVAMLGAVFIFSFWTSGASRRLVYSATGLVIIAVIVASVGQLAGGRASRILFTVIGFGLCAAAIATIFGQLAAQARVTRRTVTGALCVYLLLGLLFTYLFGFVGAVDSHGFFAQPGAHGATDYIYFSYVTLTTVGYGDLTAGSNLGRVLAVLEALMGQLYLVTIVAVVIGNIGRQRALPPSGPRSRRGRSQVADTDDGPSPASDIPGAGDPRIVRDE
jgi:hypothetical protein